MTQASLHRSSGPMMPALTLIEQTGKLQLYKHCPGIDL